MSERTSGGRPFATGVWHERYLGRRSEEVERIAAERPHTFYILTGDEIPFVQDGLRDGEHVRHGMHQLFKERLTEAGKSYVEVRGTHEVRLRAAIEAIDHSVLSKAIGSESLA